MAGKFITKRGSVWYYERGIPRDVIEMIGKRRWRISLETSSEREAEWKARPLALEHDRLIDRLRGIDQQKLSEANELLERAGIRSFNPVEPTDIDRVSAEVEENLAGQAWYQKRTLKYLMSAADELGLAPTSALGEMERLKAAQQVALQEDGQKLAEAEQAAKAIAGKSGANGGNTVGGLWDAFGEWKQLRGPVGDTVSEAESAVKRFIEVNGDLALTELTKQHVRDYRAAMIAFPKHLPKEMIRKRVPEIIEETKGQDLPTISATSVRKRLGLLRAIVAIAEESGTIDVNPFDGVRVADNGRRRRLPYTPDDLRKIVGEIPANKDLSDTEWLVLVLAHTGARLGEIVQLRKSDLGEEAGFQYLSILDDPEGEGGKRLKTEESRRAVPLHPNLLRIGFLYWAQSRASERLFEIAPDVRGRVSGLATKRVQKFIRQRVGITDPRKAPAHSFRHSFRDIALESGLLEIQVDSLLGHAPASEGRRYGLGYGIIELSKAINRINFPFSIEFLIHGPASTYRITNKER